MERARWSNPTGAMLLFFFPGIRQIHIDGLVAGGGHIAEQGPPLESEGGGGDPRVAGDELVLHQLPVDDQLDPVSGVEQQLQSGYRSRDCPEVLPHVPVIGMKSCGKRFLGSDISMLRYWQALR